MKEIKIFARAGQGAITTASILGEALFHQGLYAYAFPYFGAARMGAPMNAFLRYDNKPVKLRSQIYNPDYIIIVDPTLIKSENPFKGIKKGGIAIIGTRDGISQENTPEDIKIVTLEAERIAQEVIGKPFANTVLLGAFSKATGEVKLENILEAVKKRFVNKPQILEKNIEAVKRGYNSI